MILALRTAFAALPLSAWIAAALALSLLGNGAQVLHMRSVRAEHAAELARIERDNVAAIAAAAEQRASAIGAIALMTATDETELAERLDAATKRIERAASNYRGAAHANPLPDDCRADAERVRSINAARGHDAP